MVSTVMLSFLNRIRNSNRFLFDCKQGSNPLIAHLRFISKIPEKPVKNQSSSSLTTCYLINSCGLSPSSALSVAQKIQLKNTENADSVLNLLKSRCFSNTQITKLITKNPRLLLSSVENTLKPKIDFFMDAGFSSSEFASLACTDQILFRSSLQNRVKPNFELLSSMSRDKKKLPVTLRRSPRFLGSNLETNFLPNVKILQSYGVPPPNIAKLATECPGVLMHATKKFAKIVDSIKNLGFDPLSNLFVRGVFTMSGVSPLTWERKLGLYKSLGFSEGEVIAAFTKQPSCMHLSDKKIRKMIDFYVKRLHLEPNYLVARPVLLCLSLEKRILPRCSVLSVLSSKGLINGFPCVLYGAFLRNEDIFYNQYVSKYMDQVPDVLEAYNGNLEFTEFEGGPSTGQGSELC